MGTYLLLSFFYATYFITNLVAKQSNDLLEGVGYKSTLRPDNLGEGVFLTIDNSFTVVIVEGCNSVSVIILFIAFIIAFAEKFKKTFLFLFAGSVLIYTVNILRIAILVVAI